MANNVDITNLVLSMGSTDLHDRIGTVTEQTIGKVGETILSYTTVKNEFLDVFPYHFLRKNLCHTVLH